MKPQRLKRFPWATGENKYLEFVTNDSHLTWMPQKNLNEENAGDVVMFLPLQDPHPSQVLRRGALSHVNKQAKPHAFDLLPLCNVDISHCFLFFCRHGTPRDNPSRE